MARCGPNTNFQGLFITTFRLQIERKNTNQCLGVLRMEDQGVQSSETSLVNIIFSSFNRHENMMIGALSSKF